MTGHIKVRKAEEHNLKAIDVDVPRDRLVVVTGPSGSGKSSLVFDTIFSEGQRRYVESLSSYARRFLGRLDKPQVEKITGLPPAISIEQKGSSKNPRSTVSTSTEIHDYLRLLYANVGNPHCTECGDPMEQLTAQSAARLLLDENGGERIHVLAPAVEGERGTHKDVLKSMIQDGFVRARVNGEFKRIEKIELDGRRSHDIEVVVDRIELSNSNRERLVGSLETAIEFGDGKAIVSREGQDDLVFAEHLVCPKCGVQYEKLGPKAFSYNTPEGACPTCNGLGVTIEIDPDLVVPDKSLSLRDGAFRPWKNTSRSWPQQFLKALARKGGFSMDAPWKDLSLRAKNILLWGEPSLRVKFSYTRRRRKGGTKTTTVTRTWEGMIQRLDRHLNSDYSEGYKKKIMNRYARQTVCPDCGGKKLKAESLAVTVGGKSIDEITSMTITDALEFFDTLELSERAEKIAKLILKEIVSRLEFITSVGVEYLTLDRSSATLSGGEAQRIRLATQIGSALTGVLYCLDEPSIGLHPRDISRLLKTLTELRSLGNTVVVIEHDKDTIQAADHIIDLGPRAGINGGEVVTEGPPNEVLNNSASVTAQYLAGKKQIPIPRNRRKGNGKSIIIRGCREHNLKNIDVEFPLGIFTCVTGVSGSGKSTLLNQTFYRVLAQEINGASKQAGKYDSIEGIENIDRVVLVDQSPIGRTPRSNPATYTKVFTPIRKLFARMPESKTRGYGKTRFSFNTQEGRCEKCKGSGVLKVEMHFMSDVYVTCDVCNGQRYDRETLEVTYRDKNINDILSMTIEEALEFFSDLPKIADRLQTLVDVGLGYLELGQPSTTLSGGEAQRVKLSRELSRRSRGHTLYILDEPTTGLSASDVHVLLKVLNRLIDTGNTIIMIEHNQEVVKTADWIIDLGPEGGEEGGRLIAEGTPEDLCEVASSYTGNHLRKTLYGPEVRRGPILSKAAEAKQEN
ncbi:MAG: excinuclease ABC subunit UvrA [Candidatus Thorarchaeota archaeon]